MFSFFIVFSKQAIWTLTRLRRTVTVIHVLQKGIWPKKGGCQVIAKLQACSDCSDQLVYKCQLICLIHVVSFCYVSKGGTDQTAQMQSQVLRLSIWCPHSIFKITHIHTQRHADTDTDSDKQTQTQTHTQKKTQKLFFKQ